MHAMLGTSGGSRRASATKLLTGRSSGETAGTPKVTSREILRLQDGRLVEHERIGNLALEGATCIAYLYVFLPNRPLRGVAECLDQRLAAASAPRAFGINPGGEEPEIEIFREPLDQTVSLGQAGTTAKGSPPSFLLRARAPRQQPARRASPSRPATDRHRVPLRSRGEAAYPEERSKTMFCPP